ncbi:MAG: citrate synthase family protein [Planctomycetota bacterium]|nr:citrate synthase family protein [Planctomycetota bacterium]
MSRYLDAEDAAGQLGVSVSTLYAYVSRGLVRSEAVAGTRRRRYAAADIKRLRERQRARRDPGRAARKALHFGGLPVLESALTNIEAGRLSYRGEDATVWSGTATLEDTAALLWRAPLPEEAPPRDLDWSHVLRWRKQLPLAESFHLYLALAAAADDAGFDLRPQGVRRTGARILRGLAAVAAGRRPGAGSVASALVSGWKVRARGAKGLIERALVLSADHELNVSAFTARCVASAGSSPYAAVTGALAALQGYKHGGHSARVATLFDEAEETRRPRDAVAAPLREGRAPSGFGHPLYPRGDPRAAALMKALRAARPKSRALDLATRLARAGRAVLDDEPNIDFALVALARTFDLPRDAPFALFALGRTVGWIAHAIEQYETDQLIRPRARYTGPGAGA